MEPQGASPNNEITRPRGSEQEPAPMLGGIAPQTVDPPVTFESVR